MTTTGQTLRPEDNRRLLAASAAALAAGGTHAGRMKEAKRDVVIALERDPVLMAVRDDQIVCEPGPTGGVLLAFTDFEAAAAWDELRHPDAPAATFHPSDGLAAGKVPDRRGWLAWFQQRGAESVAINAAGPLGSLIHTPELKTARPRMLSRGARVEHPWLEADARAAERRRIAELRSALIAAAEDQDRSSFERLRPQLDGANGFGSMLWAADLQFLGGVGMVGSGQERDGLHHMIFGAFGWSRFGDPYRATDGLLDAGNRLRAAPTPKADWQIGYLNELVEVLGRMRTGYRDQEVQRLIDEAELAR